MALGQSAPIVHEVALEGLERTDSTYVFDFIKSRPGDTLVIVEIEKDVQRLKNLVSIGDAQYRLDPLEKNRVKLVYELEEVRTRVPIVNLGGIQGNTWFQLGVSDINLEGKNKTAKLLYQYSDRRHSFNFFYQRPPRLSSRWGYQLIANKWSSREPLFFPGQTVLYDYDNNGLAADGIYQLSQTLQLSLGGSFFVENYRKSQGQQVEVLPGPASLRIAKLMIKNELYLNRVDYDAHYLDGFNGFVRYQAVLNLDDHSWFHSIIAQLEQYEQISGRGNLAMRYRLAFSTNNESAFAPFVADSYINIRGIGNRIDRGTAQAIVNVEYRQTVYSGRMFSAQLVGFGDLGTWRKPGGKFKDFVRLKERRVFVGGGFRLIYNKIYGAIFRVDYGVDVFDSDQRGIVVGLGQYF